MLVLAPFPWLTGLQKEQEIPSLVPSIKKEFSFLFLVPCSRSWLRITSNSFTKKVVSWWNDVLSLVPFMYKEEGSTSVSLNKKDIKYLAPSTRKEVSVLDLEREEQMWDKEGG